MLDMKAFGCRIASLRRNARLKQKDIAECCKVSIQAVSKWETGRSCPDLLILNDLARALGVEIKDLFDEESVG